MTAMSPPACRCGLKMRPCEMTDAWECRCGMRLNAEAAFLAHDRGQSIPDDAWQQSEPWKEPDPGIRISTKYGDISAPCWEYLEVDPARFPSPPEWQRMCADAFECSGLRYVGKARRTRDIQLNLGRTLILEDGEELHRCSIYALVPLGQEADAVRGVVQAIRGMHGPGRLWAHGDVPIGPPKRRGQGGWRGAEVGGVLHVVLGCYYFHKPDAPR